MPAQNIFELRQENLDIIQRKINVVITKARVESLLSDMAITWRKWRLQPFSLKGKLSAWPDLKYHTKLRKQKLFRRIYPILVGTGNLRDSYTKKKDPDHIEKIRGNTLEIGSNVEYGSDHEDGTLTIPKRSVLFQTQEEITGYENTINDFYKNIFKSQGINVE